MTDHDNPIIEVELETMANGGSALARHDGRVVFIPYTIPGEVVEAQIVQDRGRVAFAKGVRMLEPSADRVFPACQHFGAGKCAGCQWQHMNATAQLLIKQDVLADQLERVGGFSDATVRPLIPSPQPWHYNDHMTFTVGDDGQLGFPDTEGGVLPIEVCEVLHPELLELYNLLDIETDGITSVKLMRGTDGDRMVILTAAEEEAPELELNLPASINLLLPDNEPMNLAGNTHIVYDIAGKRFRVTAGSDFRRNSAAVSNLVAEVLDALDGAKSVLDLYAGVGVFGAFIAEQADYVTLVESYPPAATDADENTDAFDHVDVIEGT
ncbi:MAG: TRAM domain-containing protein, partial [Chloroflexota bacterium]